MLEVVGLTKSYGSRQVLKNLNFQVERGKITGFLGPNGAGKTTTLDIIAGCKGAESGHVKILGHDIQSHPEKAKRHLGYLPEIAPLYHDLRVEEAIIFAAKIQSVPSSQLAAKVDKVISALDLGEVRNRLIQNLSKGFKQRVAFAQSIVHSPDVIILDEPTEGLDPIQIAGIRELIRETSKERAVLFSSHILSEVEQLCDDLIIINRGEILFQGGFQMLRESLESTSLYRLSVFDHLPKLHAQLQLSKHIDSCELKGETDPYLEIKLRGHDMEGSIRNILGSVSDAGLVLKELTPIKSSLEDLFAKLTVNQK